MESDKWNGRFLELAQVVASWSKDPSTQVGAVIVDSRNRILSTGFNGFPQRIKDDERYCNKQTKHDIVIHAEVNAILFANTNLNGLNLGGCTLYSTLMPCSRCAAIIIQSGIETVCYASRNHPNLQANFDLTQRLFEEARIKLIKG
jgi:dCMP deaminase